MFKNESNELIFIKYKVKELSYIERENIYREKRFLKVLGLVRVMCYFVFFISLGNYILFFYFLDNMDFIRVIV